MAEAKTDVEQDQKEAVKWFLKAAEQGNAPAQQHLGVMYGGGEGVKQNSKESVKWHRKAAMQDLAGAQYSLGQMYWNGIGVEKNLSTAYAWFHLAAIHGSDLSRKSKGIVAKQMTGDELFAGFEMAKELLKKIEANNKAKQK